MPTTNAAGVAIHYETMGDLAAPAVVLIEGLGAQLIGWRQGFCDLLLSRGLSVVRLDNRDAGLSGRTGDDYTLSNMAADVIAVADALGLTRFHVVGQSMGGMIAQVLAIEHPERLLSMTLFYTAPATGPAFLGPVALADLSAPVDAAAIECAARLTREQAVEAHVANERRAASTGYGFDEAWIRELGRLSYDRGHAPAGKARQLDAILRAPDRLAMLATVAVPTAIIHGRSDPLLRHEASVAIATAMPAAELHLYAGMGHQVVPELWDEFGSIIARTVARGERAAALAAAIHDVQA